RPVGRRQRLEDQFALAGRNGFRLGARRLARGVAVHQHGGGEKTVVRARALQRGGRVLEELDATFDEGEVLVEPGVFLVEETQWPVGNLEVGVAVFCQEV